LKILIFIFSLFCFGINLPKDDVISSFKEIRGAMLTTSLSSFQVFEDMADMINYANEFAKGLGPTFALVTDQIKGSFKEITVFQKGLGVTAEEFKGIVDLSLASGSSIKKIARDIGNFSLQSAKTFNLNSKEISRDITRMIKDVNHFAGLSIKDLNDISIQARKLGVEFEKLTGFSDAIETFEGASEVSARLSQQLGVTIDTMSLIKTENQAEQISLLQEAFKDAGKSSDDMGRRMLRMIAGTIDRCNCLGGQAVGMVAVSTLDLFPRTGCYRSVGFRLGGRPPFSSEKGAAKNPKTKNPSDQDSR
jgi:hypothetical protein